MVLINSEFCKINRIINTYVLVCFKRSIKMMKHVQLSPYRNRADTVSLSSNASFASLSLSPEPFTTTTSRSSSYTSLNEQHQSNYNNNSSNNNFNNNINKTTIKVYARCLRPDIEYKTLSISYETTCREVVDTLLSKYRMKHRDPRLFYLSMEVMVRKSALPLPLHGPLRTHIALDDAAKPAVLQSCHPRGDSRFSLQTRRGGLVKVYDSLLNSHSQYKSLLISTQTTTNELITLLLTCYTNTNTNSTNTNTNTHSISNQIKQFSLYEVWPAREQQRKLHPDDKPLLVQQSWPHDTSCHFLIKTNPDYRPLTRRKFPLTSKPQCQLNHFHLSEQQQQQQQQQQHNYNSSIKNLTLFEEKRKREQQERKLQHKQEHEEQIKNYNSKYNELNQSYADYENYFYI